MGRRATPAAVISLLLVACGNQVQPSASPIPTTESTPRTVAPDATATVEPSVGASDGQIAYVAGQNDPQIFLLHVASGESRQLSELVPEDAELTGGGPLRPALTCGFGVGALAWSPDGSQLAFTYGSCDTVVFLISADGELRRVDDGRSPTWAPDGSRLLYAANVPWAPCGPGCQEPGDPGELELQVLDMVGGDEPAPFTVDGSTSQAAGPLYAPDGSLIAYSGPPQGGDPETFSATYLVRADGSEARHFANGGYPVGWLPDGRLLIQRERDGTVHAVDIGSGETEQLGAEQTASVAPDGSRVLAWASDPVSGENVIRLLTATGDPLAEIPGHPGGWRPDSAAFVVISPAGDLHLVSRDGTLIASHDIGAAGGAAAWRPGS